MFRGDAPYATLIKIRGTDEERHGERRNSAHDILCCPWLMMKMIET